MRIKIFTTGGTIDKIYFDQKSQFEVGEPQIEQLLTEANITFDYDVEPLMRKDSLDIDEDDRVRISDAVRATAVEKILITHGTDTMVDTARALGEVTDKTVVFVGAMQPARLRVSDAFFNIGYAVAAVQMLPWGVYVAMNGQVFDPFKTTKNVALNRFELE
ncbi:MAG: asparaginase domain-containing protein [Chromatiales bacterium]|nr:asparaginase domain-containing protein [Chromatiales bacterium]